MDWPGNIPEEDWQQIPDGAKAKIMANERLRDAFNELESFHASTKQEVKAFFEQAEAAERDEQPWRRAMFRLVFSWIEGVIHLMKQVAYCTQGGFLEAEFSRAEIAVLRSESYALGEDGEATILYREYPGVAPNFRLACAALSKGFGVNSGLEISRGLGWQRFNKMIAVHQRLTYPDSTVRLSISGDELQALMATTTWFDEQISSLFAKIEDTLGPISARIRADGKFAQRQILENALAALQRAGEVDSVMKVVDRLLDSENGKEPAMAEKLSDAMGKLKELKGFFLNSWDS
jgi:hypothetical protein